MIRIVFQHEWINLVRSKAKLSFIFILIIAAAYSIHYGNKEIDKQKKNIVFAESECQNYKLECIKNLEGDTTRWQYRVASRPGFARWRQPHFAALKPSDLSSLSIGQRDLNPYFHNLTGLSLYMQLYKSEISNPQKLLAGNFDLSFVIIFLFPLFIIVLTYNLISGEREQGTLSLLVIQCGSVRKLVFTKLLFYFLLVSFLLILILVAGFSYSSDNYIFYLPFLMLWVVTSILYTLFWFAVMLVILTFNKSTAFNALAALSCWLLFLIIIPSLTNNIAASSYHISNAHLSGYTRRRAYDDLTDKGMTEQIKGFLKRHPEMRKDSVLILSGDKGGKAYASFVELADLEAYPVVQEYRMKVLKRNQFIEMFNPLSPAINTQMVFNKIARTDLGTFNEYQDALREYHQKIVNHYQYKIFYNERLSKQDYLIQGPVFNFNPAFNFSYIYRGMFYLGVLTFGVFLIGLVRLKDKKL